MIPNALETLAENIPNSWIAYILFKSNVLVTFQWFNCVDVHARKYHFYALYQIKKEVQKSEKILAGGNNLLRKLLWRSHLFMHLKYVLHIWPAIIVVDSLKIDLRFLFIGFKIVDTKSYTIQYYKVPFSQCLGKLCLMME